MMTVAQIATVPVAICGDLTAKRIVLASALSHRGKKGEKVKTVLDNIKIDDVLTKKQYIIHRLEEINQYIFLNLMNGNYIVSEIDNSLGTITPYLSDFFDGKSISEIEQNVITKKDKHLFNDFLNQVYFFIYNNRQHMSMNTDFDLLKIDITYNCDLRCKHCFQGNDIKTQDTYMKFDLFKNIVDEHCSYSSNRNVVLSGGEPLLHPDFMEMLEYLKKRKYKTTVLTNGNRFASLDKGYQNKLLKNIDNIQFSVDGFSEKIHDERRGNGTFHNVCKSIEKCIKKNKLIDLTITIDKNNYLDIQNNIVNFFKRFKFYKKMKCNILKVMDIGNAERDCLSFKEFHISLYKTYERYTNYFNYRPKQNFSNDNENLTNCNFVNRINYMYDGNINICGFPESLCISSQGKTLSDLRNIIEDMWKVSQQENISKCQNCSVKYNCTGWCKAENLIKNKNMLMPACPPDYPEAVLYRLAVIRNFGSIILGEKYHANFTDN